MTILDIVAPCLLDDCDGLVTLSESTSKTIPKIETELLKRAHTGWILTDLTPIESTLNFPNLLLTTGLGIMFPGPISVTTGLYSAKLNRDWFALVKINGTTSAELSIAPRGNLSLVSASF